MRVRKYLYTFFLIISILFYTVITPGQTASCTSYQTTVVPCLTETAQTVGDWTLITVSTALVSVSAAAYGVNAQIYDIGTSEDDIILVHTDPYTLVSGEYQLTLSIESDKVCKARVALEAADNNASISDNEINLQNTSNSISIPLSLKDDVSAKLSVRLGYFSGETSELPHNVSIGQVSFVRTGDYIYTGDEPVIDPNMVENPSFASGTENWGLVTSNSGAAAFCTANEEGVIHITNTGTKAYSIQFYHDGLQLYKTNKYKLSFRYRADTVRNGTVRIQQNGGTYTGYMDNSLSFTTEWKTFQREFTMNYDDDVNARLCFNLGVAGTATAVDQNIYFDDFILIMTEGTLPEPEKVNPIRVNQVGYRQGDEKTAFVISEERTFKLYSEDDSLIMTGNLSVVTADAQGTIYEDLNSGDIVRTADFSQIVSDGRYYVKVRSDKSPTFTIGQNVYDSLTAAAVKMYYYQRCGGEGLASVYVGDTFAHTACHTSYAQYYDPSDTVYGSVYADVSGGWHDAGDYGRYVTPTAQTIADLLMTAEHFPGMKELNFGGPGMLLDEARYGIEWMLKMQNPSTGGVYHKVTTQNHALLSTLPENDNAQLYLAPVSAQATGVFAAIMAHAYRTYKDMDLNFANTCLEAAEEAWGWLESNPTAISYTNPTFFGTGPYNDADSADERGWAATELYISTREAEYLDYMTNTALWSSNFVTYGKCFYAMVSYLTADNIDTTGTLYNTMKGALLTNAAQYPNIWSTDGYKTTLSTYFGGCNGSVCKRSMIMIVAAKLDNSLNYDGVILDQLNYVLGRNAMGISFVTGFGEKSATHPHHRQSIIKGQAVQGMLVGGPNPSVLVSVSDPLAQILDDDTPPAKCYGDIAGSSLTNEITILWNSPLVYLIGYLYEE